MHRNSLFNDSRSILSLVFNQMCDDAEFALEMPVFCLLPIHHTHTTLEPSVKYYFIKVEVNNKDFHRLHCTGCVVRDARIV